MDGDQSSVDGETHTAEVEIVEHHRKMIVKTSGGDKVYLQSSLGNILY